MKTLSLNANESTLAEPAAASRHWVLLVTGWLGAIAVCYALMLNYENRPGDPGDSLPSWPADSQLQRAKDGMTAIMFIHPECPCSRASLDELATILRRTSCQRVYLLFTDGGGQPHSESSNADRAKQIPGAVIRDDHHAAEARRFGSRTSGELLVFNAAGQCRFEGGVTGGRGHVGPNSASAAAAAALAGQPHITRMPVFGCPLY